MKKFIIALFSLVVAVSAPLLLLAHPGHGGDDGDHGFTIIHYFTRPVHMAITIPVVIFLVVYSVRAYRRKTNNR